MQNMLQLFDSGISISLSLSLRINLKLDLGNFGNRTSRIFAQYINT